MTREMKSNHYNKKTKARGVMEQPNRYVGISIGIIEFGSNATAMASNFAISY